MDSFSPSPWTTFAVAIGGGVGVGGWVGGEFKNSKARMEIPFYNGSSTVC